METANLERLAEIDAMTLKRGSHSDAHNAMCVMEAVAYVAGETWSDSPACACPVVSAFLRSWNDSLNDADRNAFLKPLIADLVGSKSSPAVEERRSYLALDWLIRVFTPTWFDLVPSLGAHAKALRELPEVADMTSAKTARDSVRAARAAAEAAAEDAVGAAAWDAAWDAVGDAAGAAARDAVGAAAWDAAWDAAGAAARAAVGAAARAAAGAAASDALIPTTRVLQASALQLVRAMLRVA